MTSAYINRIATAVPPHKVHGAFVEFAVQMLKDDRMRTLFQRMSARSGIDDRYSGLSVVQPPPQGVVDAYDFYLGDGFPSTAKRMKMFERFAPTLLRSALDKLALTAEEKAGIRHVLVTCCTGLYAPGLDFEAIDYLGLSPSVERTMIGFMGCYAAINALKQARHIVRSEPGDSVLIINLELCTLHFQETQNLNEVLSFLVFGDGCSVSLISGKEEGFALDSFHALQVDGTRDLITWNVRDLGFDMLLSGRVPGEIGKALREHGHILTGGDAIDLWAVHPGGRSVLDAVEEGLDLSSSVLASSRSILKRFGNMSSATVMFVLEELMKSAKAGQSGCAMSFGPGLTAETMRFHVV
ncbi:type III polyketide synthase [Terriglobus saanensis]|uniref:Chalcone and stilbene synthase domain protein n=1 Tax=Terriglobus saanensis (strain ATCC BAA-1853 / DSM 23119 / SP1PR4) TaxID=401053 RepID=E8V2B1_TERSS|nr:type III polyketide synthase [Terriglobus saanensis]ADV81244.1 chalcone and stilbene synthase domain protein [Terriglobus saanensis SP1PR4]